MKVHLDFDYNSNYIEVRYRGPDSPEISRNIFRQIIDECDKHKCYNILTIAYLENSLTTMENYDLAKMLEEEGFSKKHRLALVDLNPDTYNSTYQAETVLFYHFFNARLFQEEEEAKQWLLSGSN